ncbi:uncharacterized protein N7458_008181 [Penicillium daleae]|uniref:Uncharacterized protein n=1 Tax=Penicillium daleae TaxID=63821 RepID=A0AAD6G0Y0_9EURO|nr:uncharacterized protein N7458_008181 [Penicillium daleae]KAJ5444309.1 hypothetical protein N7458_008181 [Penicillium daleae]
MYFDHFTVPDTLTFIYLKLDTISSPAITPKPGQSTYGATMAGPSEEEIFQESIQKALAPVLSELSAPQPTDLDIHASERVIKDLTTKPTIKDMEIGTSIPVAKEMTAEEREVLVQTLIHGLDNLLENQVL